MFFFKYILLIYINEKINKYSLIGLKNKSKIKDTYRICNI